MKFTTHCEVLDRRHERISLDFSFDAMLNQVVDELADIDAFGLFRKQNTFIIFDRRFDLFKTEN